MPEDYYRLSDKDLVRKVLKKDEQAWKVLRDKYYQRIYRLCEGILKNAESFQDVEDTVEESFFKAYNNINQYNFEYAFSTWLYTIAKRECYKRLTTNTAFIYLDESVGQEDGGRFTEHDVIADRDIWGETKESQEDELERQEQLIFLRGCMGEIKEEFREVIRLYYVAGLNDREISTTLSMPERTITSRRNTAKRKLRECVDYRRKFGKKKTMKEDD